MWPYFLDMMRQCVCDQSLLYLHCLYTLVQSVRNSCIIMAGSDNNGLIHVSGYCGFSLPLRNKDYKKNPYTFRNYIIHNHQGPGAMKLQAEYFLVSQRLPRCKLYDFSINMGSCFYSIMILLLFRSAYNVAVIN